MRPWESVPAHRGPGDGPVKGLTAGGERLAGWLAPRSAKGSQPRERGAMIPPWTRAGQRAERGRGTAWPGGVEITVGAAWSRAGSSRRGAAAEEIRCIPGISSDFSSPRGNFRTAAESTKRYFVCTVCAVPKRLSRQAFSPPTAIRRAIRRHNRCTLAPFGAFMRGEEIRACHDISRISRNYRVRVRSVALRCYELKNQIARPVHDHLAPGRLRSGEGPSPYSWRTGRLP